MDHDDMLMRAALQVCQNCMGLKQGESLLVVTDSGLTALASHFLPVGKTLGAEAVLMEMVPRSVHGEEPPAVIAAALQLVDVALLITSTSLSHTDARARATDRGVRVASMPMMTEEILRGPLFADYSEIKVISEAIANRLTSAHEARLTSPAGTDLRLDLTGRTGFPDTGVLTDRGAFGNLPAGEAYIAPVEGVGHGVLVIDGVMAGVSPLAEPIVMKVEAGAVTELSGGQEAESLRNILNNADACAWRLAELGIGTNPLAKLMGHPLVDEKVRGTAHVALGDNSHMGGSQASKIHLDGIMLKPTLVLDGAVVMEEGSYRA